jgi:hypothetical protein
MAFVRIAWNFQVKRLQSKVCFLNTPRSNANSRHPRDVFLFPTWLHFQKSFELTWLCPSGALEYIWIICNIFRTLEFAGDGNPLIFSNGSAF